MVKSVKFDAELDLLIGSWVRRVGTRFVLVMTVDDSLMRVSAVRSFR
jgi:hypothetical protein